MVDNEKQPSGGLVWVAKFPDGSSKQLEPEPRCICVGLVGLIMGCRTSICNFAGDVWKLGASDPRKVVHCMKVGLALTVVSLFYYMRPLYDGVGGNAMWAVMTVVVVFEFTVVTLIGCYILLFHYSVTEVSKQICAGATLSKGINRGIGTLLAGSLAIGVHFVASHSGDKGEPIVLAGSLFLLGSAATFSRFIPWVKRRYDYGVLIFILTYSLVSVSGYRIEKLTELALQRLSTVGIGGAICVIISVLLYPIWAGDDLHRLIPANIEKLAASLEESVLQFFNDAQDDDHSKASRIDGYKCVLNSKTTEESLANFARWEPAHGPFSFKHPWKQYLKIGTLSRYCAYCIEALNGCINSGIQAPESLRQQLRSVCANLGTCSSEVLRELAASLKTMSKSSNTRFLVHEMNNAVEELQNSLKYLPETMHENAVTIIEALPVVSAAALLIEIAARIEAVVLAVDELAELAGFKDEERDQKHQEEEHTKEMKALQQV
ncbi:Aluminum-activated malate transporter 10 [Nymphaea thermarum]|nr:Aluminum-activated malate transporter 10 [Nymphaea thermarum]